MGFLHSRTSTTSLENGEWNRNNSTKLKRKWNQQKEGKRIIFSLERSFLLLELQYPANEQEQMRATYFSLP